MPTITKTRADSCKVTEILSNAFSITRPVEADDIPEPIYPERVERMGTPLAELQQVEWETYDGLYGPGTLLKRVEYSTNYCDECDGEGWIDEHGDVICEDCGLMLNESPMIVPYDPGSGRCNGNSGMKGGYVFFQDSGSPAINQNAVHSAASEPDVQ